MVNAVRQDAKGDVAEADGEVDQYVAHSLKDNLMAARDLEGPLSARIPVSAAGASRTSRPVTERGAMH